MHNQKQKVWVSSTFKDIEVNPQSRFGKLLLNVVEEGGNEAVESLIKYGNISQDTLQLDLLPPEERIFDSTVWGYNFGKMALYYLCRYSWAVRKLHYLNPVKAHVLALVSSISFYLQSCTYYAMKSLEGGEAQEGFTLYTVQQTKSRMAVASKDAKIISDLDSGDDKLEQPVGWDIVDRFLSLYIRKFDTNSDKGYSAFENLKISFMQLGENCASEANKLLVNAVGIGMKRHSSSMKSNTARHKNIRATESNHQGCNLKYKLIREYILQYHHRVSKRKPNIPIDITHIRFGPDIEFKAAILVMNLQRLNFWKICVIDLQVLNAKMGPNIMIALKRGKKATLQNLNLEIANFIKIENIRINKNVT